MKVLFIGVVSLFVGVGASTSDPSYDHQTKTYNALFDPVTTSGNVAFAPYFSPDHSMDTTVDLINSAVSTLDIAIPSISSWLSCAGYVDDDEATCAPGCTPEEQRAETFPCFPALLNALHRGVKVRLMTNDYNTPDCEGTISQLQFLALNGADVRYFTTTTFVHAKYQSADNGKLTAVSSINWSKASMTENREAGVLIDGTASEEGAELTAYMQSVFENDFKIAYSLVPGSWTTEELSVIKDPSELPIDIPKITLPAGMYITPAPSFVTDNSLSTIQASPDSAWDTIQANLNSAEESIQIAMYQITTDDLCSQLLDMNNKGINVSLMVSSLIYASYDCSMAQSCYAKLYDGGLRFRKSSTNYEYSHNKYWIIDGKTVSWSTGNWSPSDYPTDHSNTYPPYGDSDWWKSNRDFTGYTTSAATVNSFSTLFQNDWFVPETSDWSPDNDIYCGY